MIKRLLKGDKTAFKVVINIYMVGIFGGSVGNRTPVQK